MKDIERPGVGEGYKRNVLSSAMSRFKIDVEIWDRQLCREIGYKAVDLFIQATGLVRLESRKQRGTKHKAMYFVRAADETLEAIMNRNSNSELLAPVLLPMVVPPRPWETPFNGGYWTGAIRRQRLVKSDSKGYLEDLASHSMPYVYEAINAVQDTAWHVNPKVLSVFRQAVEGGGAGLGLSTLAPRPLPNKPHDIATNKDARTVYRIAASRVHADNFRLETQRIQLRKVLWVADKYADEAALYFPWSLDFRGRMYPMPLFLTPQGTEYSKALLQFAEGVPLGEQGASWLAVHGANVFGEDKVSLQDRIDWVSAHEEAIVACAVDPYENTWWTEADKPYQFLAFCFEWQGYVEQGEAYVSHLPVALDGSCNGIQNFSAMLRDPIGGAAVNLVPHDKPSDIYQQVADVVTAGLTKFKPEEASMAAMWVSYGVNRSLCKRPVLTLPYGATQFGMRAQVAEELQKRRLANEYVPFTDDEWDASVFIADRIWTAIGEVVVAARQAMDWLQDVARVASKSQLPIVWFAPSGFPVAQAYRKSSYKRIERTIGGARFQPAIRVEGAKIDTRRQTAGISPNFVHSMDASHLCFTISNCLLNGVESFAMVHDSYGTHAGKVEVLASCLRTAFVDMYREFDPLTDFYNGALAMLPEDKRAMVPSTPIKGNLDLSLVERSDFFFA